jgi:hypothetical protein
MNHPISCQQTKKTLSHPHVLIERARGKVVDDGFVPFEEQVQALELKPVLESCSV